MSSSDAANQAAAGSRPILCPFLAFSKPSMTSMTAFLGEVMSYRVSIFLAAPIAMMVVLAQKGKGILALLQNQAPDIYRLDEVPKITHPDLYQHYMEDAKRMLNEKKTNDNMVTLQDLADMKQFILEKENMAEMNTASKMEICLLFFGAGGCYKTRLVASAKVVKFLEGELYEGHGKIGLFAIGRAISSIQDTKKTKSS